MINAATGIPDDSNLRKVIYEDLVRFAKYAGSFEVTKREVTVICGFRAHRWMVQA